MKVAQIMPKLEAMGSEQSKKVLLRHGAREPFYGVKVADLKILIREIKKAKKGEPKDSMHKLALELYQTGNSDAMYMAGLMANGSLMSGDELQDWAEKAYWYMISDYTVAWTAAMSPAGWNKALEWIDSENEFIQSAGWATLSSILSVKPNEELDLTAFTKLLQRVEKTIHQAKNRVRYSMNNYVIAVGAYVPELTEQCKSVGTNIGKVEVDMGGTYCKTPYVPEYIEKIEKRGSIGKKRKAAIC